MNFLQIDENLGKVIVKATLDGLSMAGVKPVPIGVSRYVNTQHEISAIIGVVGPICGSISINVSKPAACNLASKIMGGSYHDLEAEVLDAVCEMLNIIAGKTKAILSTSKYKIEKISVPSVVVGSNYYVTHYKGMTTMSVEFELPETVNSAGWDYMFTVSVSMMKV